MKPTALSPSAIEKYSTCPRRYAFTYHLEQWEPSSPAAEAGTRVHAVLEEAKSDPVPQGIVWEGYDISRMAAALQSHTPADMDALGYEVRFEKTIEGVPFKGVVDRLYPDLILDFKTTGSDLKWAKTPTKLKKDIQRLVYSAAFPEATKALWVTGTWRSFEVVEALMKPDPKKDKEHFKLHVLTPAEEMLALPADVDPLSLPLPPKKPLADRPEACYKFPPHGCPFQEKCFPSEKKAMTSSLLDKLQVMDEPSTQDKPNDQPTTTSRFLVENLYIDCLPLISGGLRFAHEFIGPASETVAADMHVPHAMVIDFSKGPHLIAAQTMADLDAYAAEKGTLSHLCLETKSAEGRALMQVLMARSKMVVKGIY